MALRAIGAKGDAPRATSGRDYSVESYVKSIVDRVPSEGSPQKGQSWFVDSVNGTTTADGKTRATALSTIAAAVALASAGDTIYLSGSFNEAVTCSLAGLRFVGIGTGPKQAIWTAPTVAGSWCLKISAEFVEVRNIYFKPVIYTTSGVPSAIYLTGANWAQIKDCRFQGQTGSYKAIYAPAADCDNVHIKNCEFFYLNTATHGAAIWGVNAGGVQFSGWVIEGCKFHSCLTAIKASMRCGTIKNCEFVEYGVNPAGAVAQLMSLGIDLSGTDGTNSGCNVVTGCNLGGTYNATLYKVGATGDQWAGNFNVLTGGVTAANPS